MFIGTMTRDKVYSNPKGGMTTHVRVHRTGLRWTWSMTQGGIMFRPSEAMFDSEDEALDAATSWADPLFQNWTALSKG